MFSKPFYLITIIAINIKQTLTMARRTAGNVKPCSRASLDEWFLWIESAESVQIFGDNLA